MHALLPASAILTSCRSHIQAPCPSLVPQNDAMNTAALAMEQHDEERAISKHIKVSDGCLWCCSYAKGPQLCP